MTYDRQWSPGDKELRTGGQIYFGTKYEVFTRAQNYYQWVEGGADDGSIIPA